jgi:hypothetical protein
VEGGKGEGGQSKDSGGELLEEQDEKAGSARLTGYMNKIRFAGVMTKFLSYYCVLQLSGTTQALDSDRRLSARMPEMLDELLVGHTEKLEDV